MSRAPDRSNSQGLRTWLCAVLVSFAAASVAAAQDKPVTLQAELLEFARLGQGKANEHRVRAQFSVFVLELKELLKNASTSGERVSIFTDYFFKTQDFQATDNLADPDNLYVDQVLAQRQGYCLSLSVVMLAVAERLKLPLALVATPQHVFLRWVEDDRIVNIETLEQGKIRPDSFYRKRGVAQKAVDDGIYLRALTRTQIRAQLWNNHGFVRWCAGDLKGAAAAFEKALQLNPKFPEALVNSGIVAGEQGRLDEARKQLEKASVWLPSNAALHLNLAVVALKEKKSGAVSRALKDLRESGAGGVATRLARATLRRGDHWQLIQQQVFQRTARLLKEGRLAPGLVGSYYHDLQRTKLATRRIDRSVDFEWRWRAPVSGVNSRRYAVTWDGFLRIREKGKFALYLVFEQGVVVTLNGLEVISHPNGKRDKIATCFVDLEAGIHELKVEYTSPRGPNGVILRVKKAAGSETIGSDCFLHQR